MNGSTKNRGSLSMAALTFPIAMEQLFRILVSSIDTVMAMLSTLGTYAMSAQVYTMTIVRYVFVVAMAMGSATQIKTGYYVGAHEPDVAYRKVFCYQLVATGFSPTGSSRSWAATSSG